MMNTKFIPIIFIAIGVVFFVIAFRDYQKSGKEKTIAFKVRLRMAIIFSAVGIGIYILQKFIW